MNISAEIHIEPNTTGLFQPCVLVDELTSDNPYMNRGRKMPEVMNHGISKGCTVSALYSFCRMAVTKRARAPTGTFT